MKGTWAHCWKQLTMVIWSFGRDTNKYNVTHSEPRLPVPIGTCLATKFWITCPDKITNFHFWVAKNFVLACSHPCRLLMGSIFAQIFGCCIRNTSKSSVSAFKHAVACRRTHEIARWYQTKKHILYPQPLIFLCLQLEFFLVAHSDGYIDQMFPMSLSSTTKS